MDSLHLHRQLMGQLTFLGLNLSKPQRTNLALLNSPMSGQNRYSTAATAASASPRLSQITASGLGPILFR